MTGFNEIPEDRRPEGELRDEVGRISRSIYKGEKVATFELAKYSNGYRLTVTVKNGREITSYEKLEARELVDLIPAIANLQRWLGGPAWPVANAPEADPQHSVLNDIAE